MKDPVSRYLRDHAEPEAEALQPGNMIYSACVVIPAFNESAESIQHTWAALPADSLVAIVVNSPAPDDAQAATLFHALADQRPSEVFSDHCRLVVSDGSPDLLLVDRFSAGRSIPRRQGVGLARKTGCDIALRLIHAGLVKKQWLFTTDADAVLPEDYFRINPEPGDAALIQPFFHEAEAGLSLPAQLYEISLLYYAAGLQWAGSPYAYTTVGSTLTFSPRKYAQVRGFPRRNAAEDFYLLNKLAKLGRVRFAKTKPIRIAGRLSERVPVGTGPALARISLLTDPAEEYLFEHPDCFGYLKQLLEYLSQLARYRPASLPASGAAWLDHYLEKSGLEDTYLKKQKESPSPEVMSKHLMDWFDGLKSRQLIHHARDTAFGSVPLAQLAQAPFLETESSNPTEILTRLRQTLGMRR